MEVGSEHTLKQFARLVQQAYRAVSGRRFRGTPFCVEDQGRLLPLGGGNCPDWRQAVNSLLSRSSRTVRAKTQARPGIPSGPGAVLFAITETSEVVIGANEIVIGASNEDSKIESFLQPGILFTISLAPITISLASVIVSLALTLILPCSSRYQACRWQAADDKL